MPSIQGKCECEQASHFNKQEHKYGESYLHTRQITTFYGNFVQCYNCIRKNHMVGGSSPDTPAKIACLEEVRTKGINYERFTSKNSFIFCSQ